jgi:hypothetical protein
VFEAGEEVFIARPRRRREIRRTEQLRGSAGDGHPFAKLRELNIA